MFKSWISHDSGTVMLPGDLIKPLFSISTVSDLAWVLGHKEGESVQRHPFHSRVYALLPSLKMNDFLERGRKGWKWVG